MFVNKRRWQQRTWPSEQYSYSSEYAQSISYKLIMKIG